jgi:hypothetical protein
MNLSAALQQLQLTTMTATPPVVAEVIVNPLNNKLIKKHGSIHKMLITLKIVSDDGTKLKELTQADIDLAQRTIRNQAFKIYNRFDEWQPIDILILDMYIKKYKAENKELFAELRKYTNT